MIVLNKKAKIITAALVFAAIAAAGYMIERFSRDAFVEETVAVEDAVLYVEEEQSESAGLININTADERELVKLYGIGKSLAFRIVDYREKNGRYETIEEIMKVPGINESKFEELKDYITVD